MRGERDRGRIPQGINENSWIGAGEAPPGLTLACAAELLGNEACIYVL